MTWTESEAAQVEEAISKRLGADWHDRALKQRRQERVWSFTVGLHILKKPGRAARTYQKKLDALGVLVDELEQRMAGIASAEHKAMSEYL